MSINDISARDNPTQQTMSSLDQNLTLFSDNFKGVPTIIVESTSKDISIGKLHPMKVGKLFFNKFKGIQRIDPIGPWVKVTFDTIHSVNYCLTSEEIPNLGLRTYIPSTLVYSYGIINLDISVSEDDFWEGLESSAKVVNFRHISTNQHGNPPTPIRMVELKFLLPALPENVFIYKVIFKVSPVFGLRLFVKTVYATVIQLNFVVANPIVLIVALLNIL